MEESMSLISPRAIFISLALLSGLCGIAMGQSSKVASAPAAGHYTVIFPVSAPDLSTGCDRG